MKHSSFHRMEKLFKTLSLIFLLCVPATACSTSISTVTIASESMSNAQSEATEHTESESSLPTLELSSATFSSEDTLDENTQSSHFEELSAIPENITLGFAGDINLDENWATTATLDASTNGIADCLDTDLIELTNSFTLFMLNNEFTYSNRGTPMPDKMYTFRSNPTRITVLETLGTDIVLLANNHIFDYGEDAFEDTLCTLENAGISYVGAGRTLSDACNIVYYDYGDITISYVAATRAEKYRLTPQAGENSPGVLLCYDDALFLATIEEAASNSDFVVANVHFGTEYSDDFTSDQVELAHAMVDAGADAVIGTHAHVIQGAECYNGVPIFYNLGNFWFNDKSLSSCVVELTVDTQDASLVSARFYPCYQDNCHTSYEMETPTGDEILSFMNSHSVNTSLDSQGFLQLN